MSSPPNRVVIVGDGLIGLWSGVFLKKTNPQLDVTLVGTGTEPSKALTVEEDFWYLLKLIGLSVEDVLRYADGNFATSQAYFNWAPDVENYFHSSFASDIDYDVTPYNQWLLKLRQSGKLIKVDDYLPASAAAREGKIALSETHSVINASLSFDAEKFHDLLFSYASQLSLKIVNKRFERACLSESGCIEAVQLSDANSIQGDFFIDASGDESLLLGAALGVSYESWAAYFPFNCKKTFRSLPASKRLIPFIAVQLSDCGWIKNIPLRSQLIAEFRFSEDDASIDLNDPIVRMFSSSDTQSFYPGMRKKPWKKNCLALGESAVTLDGFSHSPLYLAAVSLKKFMEFWPSIPIVDEVVDEYNRLIRVEYETIRDFHCLHYFLAKKTVSPAGDLLKSVELPHSLQYRIDLFRDSGHLCADESTLIASSQWINLFLGLGYWPKNYDYLLSHVEMQHLEAWGLKVKNEIDQSTSSAPEYTSYIKQLMKIS